MNSQFAMGDTAAPPSGSASGSRVATRTLRRPNDTRKDAPTSTYTAYDDSNESMTRLIAETAHDLRAPLTTVRESIRLVRDGELGQLSATQRECLSAAINQCNCAGQLVDEMVQSRQFESGFPNVRRTWVSLQTLRESVDETLRPWVMPRNVHLLWDGPFERDEKVYADPVLLRRLIVNLAGNAIRVTRDGCPVLIRAKRSESGNSYRWSVVDQGIGITPTDLELIASGQAPTRSTGGLGLIISRNLAAAHFSTLRIESRVGTGTAVSFRTVTGGPIWVARAWAAWREGLVKQTTSPVSQKVRELPSTTASHGAPHPPRKVRIDAPASSVEIGCRHYAPAYSDQMVLTSVNAGAALPPDAADQFEGLIQRSMRVTEFAYRVGERNWVIAWDADREAAVAKRNDLENQARKDTPGVRLSWNGLHKIDVATSHGGLASRLCDLIVRHSLANDKQGFVPESSPTTEQHRPQICEIAEGRLDREVHRLRERQEFMSDH